MSLFGRDPDQENSLIRQNHALFDVIWDEPMSDELFEAYASVSRKLPELLRSNAPVFTDPHACLVEGPALSQKCPVDAPEGSDGTLPQAGLPGQDTGLLEGKP